MSVADNTGNYSTLKKQNILLKDELSKLRKDKKIPKLLTNSHNTEILPKTVTILKLFKEKLKKNKSISFIKGYDSHGLDTRIKKLIELNKDVERKKTSNDTDTTQDIVPLKAYEQISRTANAFEKYSKMLFNNYYSEHYRLLNRVRDKIAYINKWKNIIETRKTLNKSYNDHDDFLVMYTKELMPLLQELKATSTKDIVSIIETYNNKFMELDRIVSNYLDTGDPILEHMRMVHMKNVEAYQKKSEKLVSLYSINYSFMEIITDSKFLMMYVLKITHLAIFVAALFLSEKLFLEMYMKKVYAENSDPPPLYSMLGILLLIDIGFTLFLVTILVLIMYIFNTPDNSFIINPELIITFLFDFALFMFFVLLMTVIIASVIQLKRYFRYKTEGLRGIRAFKEIILGVAGSLTLIPFFSFYQITL